MGQINAIVKKLGGYERALRFLGDELIIQEKEDGRWHVKNDGVVYFQVITDGTTGEAWIERLNSSGVRIGGDNDSYQILNHSLFIPTNRMVTKVAVLPGLLFKDSERTVEVVRAEAVKRNLSTPDAELACYICEKFSDKAIAAMGLKNICVMHNPIELHDCRRPYILGVDGRDLRAVFVDDRVWWQHVGFAFVVSQTRSEF